MMGAKKYEVLKRFADAKRQDLVLHTVQGGNVKAAWDPMETLILIHLCSMGFVNATIENGALVFALTDDGRIYLNGARAELVETYGRGAG